MGLGLGLDRLVIGIWEGMAGRDFQVGIRIGLAWIGIGIGRGWDGMGGREALAREYGEGDRGPRHSLGKRPVLHYWRSLLSSLLS